MIRLAEPVHRDVPGETNAIERIPRGVVVVIPPWNFPLAIPTGMTAAALVAGNAVILKPAEQSPVIAMRLHDAFHEAGLPKGASSIVPGKGEVVGAAGGRPPGRPDRLHRVEGGRPGDQPERAAETPEGQDHVKRVIAEMGGKNALIVDDDADLDEAVVGVLQSAFGYSGQKCSACSRVVVFEWGLRRLRRPAGRGRPVDPDRPARRARDRRRPRDRRRCPGPDPSVTLRSPGREGRVVFEGEIRRTSPSKGHYVAPLIVADVAARCPGRPGRNLRPDPRRDPSPTTSTMPWPSPTGPRIRPDRRPLLAEPGDTSTGSSGGSASATSTSTGRSPGPWSTASRSAASSSPGSAGRRREVPTTSASSSSPGPSPRTP